MGIKKTFDGVEVVLSEPDEIQHLQWVGREMYISQLLAAWTIIDAEHDIPMNPQILGRPGVGKTTLAYSAAKTLNLPVYIFQCTVDTRPEDLLISPVIGEKNTIVYHASSLVSAMVTGGVCILDEANRMAEKSWASLAPLLDQRRYVESIIAGIKINAHPDFRICVTMNEDSSTFEVPEYIHSRLQPQIYIEFPDFEEELHILQFNLPFTPQNILSYTVQFLQKSHHANRDYTIRDGINICRYYMKMNGYSKQALPSSPNTSRDSNTPNSNSNNFNKKLFQQAIYQILGQDGLEFYLGNVHNKNHNLDNPQVQDLFDQLNSIFFDEKLEDREDVDDNLLDGDFDEDDLLDDSPEDDIFYDDFPQDIFGEEDDDYVHILDKEEHEKPPQFRSKRPSLDPIIDDEPGNSHKSTDPNELIRQFLERKRREQKKKKQSDNTDPSNSTPPPS